MNVLPALEPGTGTRYAFVVYFDGTSSRIPGHVPCDMLATYSESMHYRYTRMIECVNIKKGYPTFFMHIWHGYPGTPGNYNRGALTYLHKAVQN